MTNEHLTAEEQHLLDQALYQMNEQGWGVATGLLLGIGLFVATNFLVLKGGEQVGPHLGLLRWYFPGYSVTFIGSLVGGVYAFVLGYGIGRTIAVIYNRLTKNVQ